MARSDARPWPRHPDRTDVLAVAVAIAVAIAVAVAVAFDPSPSGALHRRLRSSRRTGGLPRGGRRRSCDAGERWMPIEQPDRIPIMWREW